MRIDCLTLFPAMFLGPLTESILKRATDDGLLSVHLHDLRQWGTGTHRQVDDTPYGGGAGMLLKVDVLVRALEDVQALVAGKQKTRTIYLSPRGKRLTQTKVERLATVDRLIFLCGRYEGIDHRVIEGKWIDEELSIGDYVLTGGELPAMVLIDAVARHIPGVLGHDESAMEESFSKKLGRKREYPHYTKPATFRDLPVPPVLLSGNHREIEQWRSQHTL